LKPLAKAKPALKKSVLKKATVKPAANNKLRKAVAKARPAKAIVKGKQAIGNARPPLAKTKPAVKSKAASKAPVKLERKGASVKKKR
jgi:hypothetical protein